MKATVIGVTRVCGNKNGRDYDMARLIILTPAESREGQTKENNPYRVRAFGYDTAELDLALEALPKFERIAFPVELTLKTETEFRFGRMQSVVSDFSQEGAKGA